MVAQVGTCSRCVSGRTQEPSGEPGPALQHLVVFTAGQVEEHERVFYCETALSKEALLNRIDSSQCGSGLVVHCRSAILPLEPTP